MPTPGAEPGAVLHFGTRGALTDPSRVGGTLEPARIVDPRGRSKILRPLPVAEREAAVARGLAAYARGDFYLAHEELEPAWMGSADPGEREVLAGLIKVAAAFVHASRGNPAGAATNLRGARARLAGAADAGHAGGFDVAALLWAVDDRLARLALLKQEPADLALDADVAPVPDPRHEVAGPPGRARRPPLALEPPTIERRLPT
jgi:predicted metal-dependent hydrolase